MRIIELFIRGKNPDQSLCEDGVFIGAKIAAVIDGATSHGTLSWNGGSSGWFAKEVLCEYLRDHEEELAVLSAGECMLRLNNVLAEKGEEIHPGKKAIAEYPRASIILYNSAAGEVWSYGDCQCMIGEQLHSEIKEVDRLLAELRAFVVWSEVKAREDDEWVLEQIARNDVGRAAVLPFIEKQLRFENTSGSFGYPVLNGLNYAVDMVKVWSVPEGAEVVLASDGYPELCGTLAESEERLWEVNAEDPLCIGRNAGVKAVMEGMESFDDRAFVRVSG